MSDSGIDQVKLMPVTVVTGWLGAGKTTLVRSQVESRGDEIRFAVVNNDLSAELGVEHEHPHMSPVPSQADDDGGTETKETPPKPLEVSFYGVGGGCVCCSGRLDVYNAVAMTLSKRDEIDHLIVETTGAADPLPFVKELANDALLAVQPFVVTVVDAHNFLRDSGADGSDPARIGTSGDHGDILHFEMRQQLACADVVVVNKIDTVADDERETVVRLATAAAASPNVRVITSAYGGGIDLVDLHAEFFDGGGSGDRIIASLSDDALAARGVNPDPDALPDAARHRDLTSFCLYGTGRASFPALSAWLEAFLEEGGRSGDVFRIKGVFDVDPADNGTGVETDRVQLQGVHGAVSWSPLAPWGEDEKRTNRLVFIGKPKALAWDEIRPAVEACFEDGTKLNFFF